MNKKGEIMFKLKGVVPIFQFMSTKYFSVNTKIKMIYEEKDIEKLSIESSIFIARQAGYFNKALTMKISLIVFVMIHIIF